MELLRQHYALITAYSKALQGTGDIEKTRDDLLLFEKEHDIPAAFTSR